jgi:hypothetical protein
VLSQSEILPADTAPLARRHGDSAAPKRDRRQYLTKIDNRSRLGIRIRELKALFESAFPAGELTPLRREKIGDAAQLKALAEEQRGAWLRGEAMIQKLVEQWIAGELAKTLATQTGAATRTAAEATASTAGAAAAVPNALQAIAMDAAQAYGGVFAFFAPLLGLGAAGPAAAAEGSVMAAGGAIASADIGMYNVPQDQVAMIHRNELVMPAPQASAFRSSMDAMAQGGGAGVAIHPTTHLHMSALDGPSVGSWMRQNGPGMAKALDQAVRHGAALGLKRLSGR